MLNKIDILKNNIDITILIVKIFSDIYRTVLIIITVKNKDEEEERSVIIGLHLYN